MQKRRLTRILAKMDKRDVEVLAADIQKIYTPLIVKEPGKTLAMVKMRDPVKQTLFYIGEVIVCEAAVEIDGVQGVAVLMGDDTEKTLDMAIIDAAINRCVFAGMDKLLNYEKEQNDALMRENAMHLKTMVCFESMDQEMPHDLAAFKKA
ncbi:MAG: phosphonate C-P lyase system protein PhnG [Dehalococcoidia bacterium]|nr:phosphonate C-P lyase system protein PhnG [Dehalococcoidia bacterium]